MNGVQAGFTMPLGPNAVSWVNIDITSTDGTKAAEGGYYIRFNEGCLPGKLS